MNCKEKIKENINMILNHTGPLHEFGEYESKYIQMMVSFPSECSVDFLNYAEELFEQIEANTEEENEELDIEYELDILFSVMQQRKQYKCDGLLKKALLSEKTEGKEALLFYLINSNFSIEEKVELTRELLRITESFDEYGGYDRTKAVEFLIKENVKEAWPEIKDCLIDEANRVREVALRYFRYFGVMNDEVFESLVNFMNNEEEEEFNFIKKAINIFVHNKIKKAIEPLKELGKQEWFSEIPNSIDYLNESIKELESV